MHPYILLGLVLLGAYLLQTVFSLKQIKHFNAVYSKLRAKGKVAIGRRPGKIQSGTIFMFALDNHGNILDATAMQGVTVLAKFKDKSDYIGEKITSLSMDHPVVAKENKLVKQAVLDAKDLYIKVSNNDYHEEPALSPFSMLKVQAVGYGHQLKNVLKK